MRLIQGFFGGLAGGLTGGLAAGLLWSPAADLLPNRSLVWLVRTAVNNFCTNRCL